MNFSRKILVCLLLTEASHLAVANQPPAVRDCCGRENHVHHPMGSDDGKSIMAVASSGRTASADENHSHGKRNKPTSLTSGSNSPTSPSPQPPSGPARDSVDADLPDGTRVVSTSTTVNGLTTVTAQLFDKDCFMTLAHHQQSGEIDLSGRVQSLPNGLSDGRNQNLQVMSLTRPNMLSMEACASSQWIDVEGDGKLTAQDPTFSAANDELCRSVA